jgi:hypothetical protein
MSLLKRLSNYPTLPYREKCLKFLCKKKENKNVNKNKWVNRFSEKIWLIVFSSAFSLRDKINLKIQKDDYLEKYFGEFLTVTFVFQNIGNGV